MKRSARLGFLGLSVLSLLACRGCGREGISRGTGAATQAAPSPSPTVSGVATASSTVPAPGVGSSAETDSVSKLAAMKFLNPSFDPKTETIGSRRVEAFDLQPWRHHPDALAMYWVDSEREAGPGDGLTYQLHAAVLQSRNGSLAHLARSSPILLEVEPEQRICASCTMGLDLANFRVGPTDVAIGVRVYRAGRSGESSSNTETLHLFRIRGGSLDPILEVKTKEDKIASRTRSESTEVRRVVQVTQQLSRGMYDVVVRSAGPPEDRITYRWDPKQNRYIRKGSSVR